MSSWVGVLLRLVMSLASIVIVGAALDNIHDRSTEIAVSCIGLTYCGLAAVFRRWQHFGFSLPVLIGAVRARRRDEPYDMGLRSETGLDPERGFVFVTQVALAMLAALFVLRLAASVTGHGWDRLFAQLRPLVDTPWLKNWLDSL